MAYDVRIGFVLGLATALLFIGCRKQTQTFAVIRADRTVAADSKNPLAIDPSLVGSYPPKTKSGAGYFYDDVLEYRVWLHPEQGAEPLNGSDDYYLAFAQYERAEAFSKNTTGAEQPLVLVRQREWIDEPSPGKYHPEKGERITEWQVKWLANDKRTSTSIEEFMTHPRTASSQQQE